MLNRVFNIAEPELIKLNPILPKDEVKRKNQLRLFREEIASYGYEFKEGSSMPLILNKDQTTLVNQHNHPVKIADLVREIASKYWDFEEKKKDPAPDPKKKGQGGGSGGSDADAVVNDYPLVKPNNDSEYSAALSKISNDKALTVAQSAKIKMRLKELYRGGGQY